MEQQTRLKIAAQNGRVESFRLLDCVHRTALLLPSNLDGFPTLRRLPGFPVGYIHTVRMHTKNYRYMCQPHCPTYELTN